MYHEEIEKIVHMSGANKCVLGENGDFFIVVPLMFHVAVYVNPDVFNNAQDRYCFINEKLAEKAIDEYLDSGVMRYWQKHHNENISIEGEYAYPSGVHNIPENALYKVDWNINELNKKYKYQKKA